MAPKVWNEHLGIPVLGSLLARRTPPEDEPMPTEPAKHPKRVSTTKLTHARPDRPPKAFQRADRNVCTFVLIIEIIMFDPA